MILMFSSRCSKCISYKGSTERFVVEEVGKNMGGGINVFNGDVIDCSPGLDGNDRCNNGKGNRRKKSCIMFMEFNKLAILIF